MKRATDWMLRIAVVGLILSAPALRAADDDASHPSALVPPVLAQ